MRFTSLLASLALLPIVLSTPAPQLESKPPPNTCTKPAIRKEWRQLTIPERKAYIAAVKCLHSKPAQLGHIYVGTTSRYEDFTQVHKLKTPYYHETGFFLIWHRQFLSEFEYALQSECGYKGNLPYWDYTIDAYPGSNFSTSPIFDKEHGFGGNGAYDPKHAPPGSNLWGGGCIKDGPFKDFRFRTSRGWTFNYEETPRCLTRNFWYDYASWAYQDKEDKVYEQTDFVSMQHFLEGTPGTGWDAIHSGGHFIVGGPAIFVTPDEDDVITTGSEVWTSPLEPLFYLHHANIDRIWGEWQKLKPEYKFQVGGHHQPRVHDIWGFTDAQWGFEFLPKDGIKLDSYMDLGPMTGKYPKLKVAEVMDTKGGTAPNGVKGKFCWEYSKPPKRK